MARMFTKTSRDPYFLPNDKAKKISDLMKSFLDKKIEDTWLDIDGSVWKGMLSQVKTIELDEDRKYAEVKVEKPMTKAESELSDKAMLKVRENLRKLGIIKN